MTADAAAVPAETPTDLSASSRARILVYLGFLVFMVGLGSPFGGLINIPVTFFLKNKLHFTAVQTSVFQFWVGLPLYLGFVWGFVRDTWNPMGRRDRGYMIFFGGLTAAFFVAFAFTPVSVVGLFLAIVLITSAYLFVQSAQVGLGSTIARQHVMSGQMSAVMNSLLSIATLVPFIAGGYLSDLMEGRKADEGARIIFLTGAAILAIIGLFAIWRPRVVYDNVHTETGERPNLIQDMIRLFRHKPVYPALLIWLLWNFAPGSVTPLQYYLQNTLHASDDQFSSWNAIFAGGFIPTYALFGYLCRRMPLSRLLFWGTVVAVPQLAPLLLAKSIMGSWVVAGAAGLMGGVATAAYLDLLIRSCPKGLEGTILMASNALYYLVSRAGDILGSFLYDRFHGFTVCVIAITVVYALILPTLSLVPKRLTATADGEALEGGFDAEIERL